MSDNNEEAPGQDEGLGTIAQGASWVLGGRVVKLGLLFFVQILMARILGTDGYGSIVLATMLISISVLLAKLGMDSGLTRKIPHYEDDSIQARGALWAGITLSLFGSVLVGVVLFFSAPFIALYIFNEEALTSVFRIAAAAIPFSVSMRVGISIARGSRDAKTHVIIRQFLFPIADFGFITAFVLLGFGTVGAISGHVLAYLLAAVGALVLAYKTIQFEIFGHSERKFAEMLTFSLPLILASGMSFLISNTDTFLIGFFLSSDHVGLYNSAFQLKKLGMVFFYPLAFLLPPVITRLQKSDERDEIQRTYQIVTKWMTLTTLPILILVFFFPDIVIGSTFGAEYIEASTALRALLIAIFGRVFFGANDQALLALGHSRIHMYINTLAAGINVVLNIVLIPTYGITGAAIASGLSFILRDFIYAIALYDWHGVHPFSNSMIRPFGVVLFLSPIFIEIFKFFFNISFVTLSIFVFIGALAYVFILVNMGAIDDEDIDLVNDVADANDISIDFVKNVVNLIRIVNI